MNDWFKIAASAGFGVFLKHLWDKFVRRIIYLDYTINFTSIGRTVEDARFGTIEIVFNGNKMNNLYLCTINVENRTNHDIQNLKLNIFGDTNNQILISYGRVVGSPNALKFTEEYSRTLEEAQNSPTALNTALSRRDYVIPVLNRSSVASIDFVGNKPSGSPEIFVNCDHVGIKTRVVKALPHFFGEPKNYCALLGLISVVGIGIYLCTSPVATEHINVVVALSLFSGLAVLPIGWIILKSIRWVSRVIS